MVYVLKRKKFMSTKKTIIINLISLIIFAILGFGLFSFYQYATRYEKENKTLKEIIARLTADTRIAEALVSDVTYDPLFNKHKTTIKFLEYDTKGNPLKPQYFTFFGNIIQFQSLVVRFDDFYVKNGDALRGKSAYLFGKVFFLDGAYTQEYDIAKVKEIPEGYKIDGNINSYEVKFWTRFWEYALDPRLAKSNGIKNAQIEAPGTKFIPGMIYTIKIEHDGGMRIDASPIPNILKGEKIPGQ